jgi:two-component system CheB/CheR fusion protein
VGIYSRQKQEWTSEHFRLADWLAAQCARILETLRLQEQLRRLYAEQQTIFNSVPAMIWYKDTKNNFVRVNRAVASAVGRPPGEIEGKSAYEIFPDEAEHYYRDDLEVINSGQPKLGIVEEMGTARGEKRWVRTDKIPCRGDGGDITGVLLFTVDITERKRAEEELARLAAIVESSDDAILSKDLDGIIRTWNAGAERLFGYRAEEVIGRPVTLLLPPERIREEGQILERLLDGERVERLETVRVAKDGRRIDVSVTVSPVKGQDGRIIGASKIVRDITDRKLAEEAMKTARDSAEHAKAAAEQANRAKDHFLAALSHELRTPLTPVVMGLSMLQDRPGLDPAVRETLEMVRRHVEMEARLVDDLLDVSRIAQGKFQLTRSTIELCTIIQRAVEVCMPDIEARRLHFGVDLGPAAPYWVDVDVPRLQQVFWNLLKNAIKFTSHGGCVGIRCRPSGNCVIVEVNDSGIGIEPQALARIFNAFEQADRSITQQFGGLGLGLAISRALVEMHGGRIEAHSEGRGKGATFSVRLPLCAPAGRPAAPAPAAPPQRAFRPLRILLVEDHGVTAKMMRMVLAADGHSIETAGDVATALELAGQHAFDLLLSDLGLPDGSGYDLMRQLRERGHKFPAIALSGYGQGEDIERSRRAGFAAHLTKPASREAVVEAVASVTAAK